MPPLDEKTKEQIVAGVLAARSNRPQMLVQMKQRQQQGPTTNPPKTSEGFESPTFCLYTQQLCIKPSLVLGRFSPRLALHLHSFYTGAERIFYDIARDIDLKLPTGSDWHQQLLEQMSVEIPLVRQSVLAESTRLYLDEFRRFRHVVRSPTMNPPKTRCGFEASQFCLITQQLCIKPHLVLVRYFPRRYAYQLDPARVVELAQKLPEVSQHLMQDCQRFCGELKSQDQDIPR